MERLILATRVAQWYNPIDIFLSRALNSKYIHSELIFPIDCDLTSFGRNSFSSRGRIKGIAPKIKGVSFARVDYTRGRWIYTSVNFIDTLHKILMVHNRCLSIDGKQYDTLGAVLRTGFKLPLHKKNKYWCSEAIGHVLNLFIPISKYDIVNPEFLLQSVRWENSCYIKI